MAPAPAVQRAELRPLMAASMRLGESWYLLSSRWFSLWKRYVGYDRWDVSGVGDPNLFPGPIDNACLLSDGESQSLKEHLIAQLDYVLVPSSAWQKLVSWYRCIEGQQPIVRKVMEFGLYAKHCEVEVYPLELKLCESSSPSNVISCCFSRRDTTLVKEIRKLFKIPAEKDVRLWSSHFDGSYEQLSELGVTLEDANIYHGELVLIEVKNEDGTWPQHPFLSTLCCLSSRGSGFACNSYSSRDSTSLSQPGLCGLSNLGNTCFMNSALQCLSNTPPLTDYFLEDKYEAEINHSNPLGMRGEIAEAYAELIKQIWSGRQSHVAPRMFKTQVGRFAPQFSGYQQQDSQELLAFLLDGLHEDLNRVKKKPYLELKDANGRPDSVVAKEAWENHRLRNDSIIVDIFHGLFKSTLVCPKCSKVSVTFDPFCYLTLPLPLKRDRLLEVTLVYADPQRRPVQYRVVVPMMGAISDLCESLSKLSGVPAENMVVTDVYNHRFHKIFQADEGLNHIMPKDDIFPSEDGSEYITFSVYFREKAVRQSSSTSGTILFGQPLLMSVPKHKLTVDHLYVFLLLAFSTLAIDWDSDTRRLLFDEQEAQAFEKHASVLQPQKMKAVVALKDCIELFTTMETLGEHDPWYCPNCKKHQQATKKFDLWSLPKILVVHLKRFSYSRYWRDKLDTVVEFPIRGLNMSEFVCDPRGSSYVYDLIAVSNHYGAMGVGHYTAYAKNKVNGKWYYFDDSSVSLASEDQIVTKAAYVLFYQRRNNEEHVAPSPPHEECDGMDTN
uniref:Ubiquitin carboxyl-terminal hydrolase n=1 Tax=Phasianus colchicus TaxID=9054 RepID=A0A669QJB2_PHACC